MGEATALGDGRVRDSFHDRATFMSRATFFTLVANGHGGHHLQSHPRRPRHQNQSNLHAHMKNINETELVNESGPLLPLEERNTQHSCRVYTGSYDSLQI